MQRGYRSRCLQPNRASPALVPHGHRFTLHMGYARSEAPGGPGSSSRCSRQGVLTSPQPSTGSDGGSAAQGASENFKEIKPRKISVLVCTLC